MGKLKFTLSNILFWISLIASCLLLENVAFLTSNSKGGLSDTHFFMLFALAMIGYIAYFVVEHVKNKVKIDFFLIGIIALLFGCSIIAIWSLRIVVIPGKNVLQPIIYTQDVWEQTRHTLSLLTFVFTIYSVLFYFNKNYPSIRKISVIYIIILIICYASMIYSFITETKSYEYFLTRVSSRGLFVKSFFWHSNMFSGMMLMGIAASIGLNIQKKNVFSYISIILFFIMSIVIGAMTTILISMISISVYFLFEIIMHMRKKLKSGFVLLAIYLSSIVAIVVIYSIALQGFMGSFSIFCKSLYVNISNSNFNTYTGRTSIWAHALEFLSDKPLNILFGVGFRNSNQIIGDIFKSSSGSEFTLSAHSGYLQILMNFGIVGCIVYLAFLVYCIYCFVRLLKYHARFALLYLLIGIMFTAYSFTESVIFFNPNTQGILVGLAFYLPVVNKWKHVRHHELGDDVINVEQPKVMDSSLVTKFSAKAIMCLLAVTASLFVFPLFTNNEHYKYLLINIFVVLFISLLTLPIIISSQSIKRSRTAFIINVAINLLLVFGSIALLIVFYLEKSLAGDNQAIWVYPILLTIVLVGEAIIFSVGKRRTFSDYVDTFIGATKNSFMGLVGVGLSTLATSVLIYQMDIVSPLTFIVYIVINALIFYLFTYFIPFKDNKAIVNHFNNLALYSLKKDVLKDRLGAYNEKRKD